jgi:hypothetical protein
MFDRSFALALVLFGLARGVSAQSPDRAACSSAAAFRSTGASVAVIDSAALTPFFHRTLSEALTARLPGVSVMASSGVAGAGSRVRLRGPSGIILTQQPLLFVDGIRVDDTMQSNTISTGGQAPSRLDDIPMEDVECIYVLRGPATTARYGTDAAVGVIHVITRSARSDSARVRMFLEGGATQDVTNYPANFGNPTSCTLARAASGQCETSPLRSWSPIEADSPFRTAPLLHGGGHATILANERSALGVSGSATIDDGAFRRNDHRQYSVGTNGSFRPESTFSLRGDLWLLGGHTVSPLVGSALESIINSALVGSSVDDPVRRGYRNYPLSVLEQFASTQDVRRLGGVVHLDWAPRPWLVITGLAGREDSKVSDWDASPFITNYPPGFEPATDTARGELRTQRTSARASAVATYGSRTFRFTTETGVDYLDATDRRFAAGDWQGFDPVTTGWIARQAVAWDDRRFIEVGVRHDVLHRLFEVHNPTYPFASASWDIGRESFLAGKHAVSSLRIRGAYGENGDSRALILAFNYPLYPPGASTTLSVERTREVEAGVDLGFLGDRIVVDATVFSKQTSGGLFEYPAGFFSALGQDGEWRNRGLETAAHARIVDAARIKADVAITFTTLDNRITSLGSTPFLIGTGWRLAPGYPLYGAWGRGYTFKDANGDGVIVPAEIALDTADRYLGSPVPTRELSVAPSLVLGKSVTIAALIDYRGGFRSFNAGGRNRCNTVCEPLYAPNATLAEQARAVSAREGTASWIEDASFVRVRELSVAWAIPPSWAKRVGAHSSSVVFAGRNLFRSTDYTGLDPEGAGTGQTQIAQADVFTLPLPATLSLRLDVAW